MVMKTRKRNWITRRDSPAREDMDVKIAILHVIVHLQALFVPDGAKKARGIYLSP
jgi:hypothetical protein